MQRCTLITVSTYGLASLLAEEVDHLLGVLGPDIAVLLEELLALLNGHESVGLEGLGGALDSGVDILLGGNRDSPKLLAGDGVDTVVLLLGVDLLAGDGVGERVPLDRHDGYVDRDGGRFGTEREGS